MNAISVHDADVDARERERHQMITTNDGRIASCACGGSWRHHVDFGADHRTSSFNRHVDRASHEAILKARAEACPPSPEPHVVAGDASKVIREPAE